VGGRQKNCNTNIRSDEGENQMGLREQGGEEEALGERLEDRLETVDRKLT